MTRFPSSHPSSPASAGNQRILVVGGKRSQHRRLRGCLPADQEIIIADSLVAARRVLSANPDFGRIYSLLNRLDGSLFQAELRASWPQLRKRMWPVPEGIAGRRAGRVTRSAAALLCLCSYALLPGCVGVQDSANRPENDSLLDGDGGGQGQELRGEEFEYDC